MAAVDSFVLLSLILNIALDDIFVGILPNCVHVETARPEVSSPQKFSDFGVGMENMSCSEALHNLGNTRRGEGRNTLQQKMHVILICPDFDETDLEALLNLKTDLFERPLRGFCKSFSSVFHGTDQVVQQKSLVVTFVDVITHPKMLHLQGPTPQPSCEVFWNNYEGCPP